MGGFERETGAAAKFGDGTAAPATLSATKVALSDKYSRKNSREALERMRREREQRRYHKWFENYAKRHGTTLAEALRGGGHE